MTGGRRFTSSDMPWEDLPKGVLVLRWWNGATGNGINWDDGLYGRPDTLKAAGLTDDETFAAVLAEAQGARLPPSER